MPFTIVGSGIPKLALCFDLYSVFAVLLGLSVCIHCSLEFNSISQNGAVALAPAFHSLTSLRTLK